MNAIRVNEVPSLIVIRCELAEVERNRFDWMDVRAYISNVRFQLNERPNLTSNVPDIVGYRWFLENTKTLLSFEEWKANCIWVISPQQLAVDPAVFTESLARVNTITIEATIERPKAYKNASMVGLSLSPRTYEFRRLPPSSLCTFHRLIAWLRIGLGIYP